MRCAPTRNRSLPRRPPPDRPRPPQHRRPHRTRHGLHSADRVAGYRRALAEAVLGPESEQILFGEYNEASGYEMTRRVLTAQPRPTAIFAGNNFIAFGAIQALREAGMAIPDGHVDCRLRRPAPGLGPRSIPDRGSQPAYEIGKQAAELMLERLTGDPPGRTAHHRPAERADRSPVDRAAASRRSRQRRSPPWAQTENPA
jgi:hypothetical protein